MKIIKLQINKTKNRRRWLIAGLGWPNHYLYLKGVVRPPQKRKWEWFHHPRDRPTWGSGWLGHPI